MIKLNIACGPNIFPFDGWTNYDREDFNEFLSDLQNVSSHHLKNYHNLVQYVHTDSGKQLSMIVHDLRDGFPQHEDNSVELIYMGQAIEHINPLYEAPQFLKECHRMLVPGGVLRMTTPDLDLLINAYLAGEMGKFAVEQPNFYKRVDPSAQLAMLMYGSCGEKSTWNYYEGHMFLYTQRSMTTILNDVGFSKLAFYYEAGKSFNEVMAKEAVDEGLTHSFIVEAVK